jgi:hypothetical protein
VMVAAPEVVYADVVTAVNVAWYVIVELAN